MVQFVLKRPTCKGICVVCYQTRRDVVTVCQYFFHKALVSLPLYMTHAVALDQNIKGEQRTQQDHLTEHNYVLAVVLIN